MELLLPRGWRLATFEPARGGKDTDSMLVFESPERLSWLPGWARKWLHMHTETNAALRLDWYFPRKIALSYDRYLENAATHTYETDRLRPVPGRGYWIVNYVRSDEFAYRATRTTILDSVRVR